MAISASERAFFERLGTRIAELRKQQDITQVEMAKALGVSQQTINSYSYEVGRRRIPVSALSTLTRTLGVSLEELLGKSRPRRPKNAARRRSCSSRWSGPSTCPAPSSASLCTSSIPCWLSRTAKGGAA